MNRNARVTVLWLFLLMGGFGIITGLVLNNWDSAMGPDYYTFFVGILTFLVIVGNIMAIQNIWQNEMQDFQDQIKREKMILAEELN